MRCDKHYLWHYNMPCPDCEGEMSAEFLTSVHRKSSRGEEE